MLRYERTKITTPVFLACEYIVEKKKLFESNFQEFSFPGFWKDAVNDAVNDRLEWADMQWQKEPEPELNA